MGDHLGIIIFSSILQISLISLSELHKTPIARVLPHRMILGTTSLDFMGLTT